MLSSPNSTILLSQWRLNFVGLNLELCLQYFCTNPFLVQTAVYAQYVLILQVCQVQPWSCQGHLTLFAHVGKQLQENIVFRKTPLPSFPGFRGRCGPGTPRGPRNGPLTQTGPTNASRLLEVDPMLGKGEVLTHSFRMREVGDAA